MSGLVDFTDIHKSPHLKTDNGKIAGEFQLDIQLRAYKKLLA